MNQSTPSIHLAERPFGKTLETDGKRFFVIYLALCRCGYAKVLKVIFLIDEIC